MGRLVDIKYLLRADNQRCHGGPERVHAGLTALGKCPQCLFEWAEPGLKIPPLIEAFLENRPAPLFGTRGSYAAFGFIELDALRFESESAEIQNAAHIAFEIVDHILVLDPQDLARQDCVPVLHLLAHAGRQ